MENEALDINHLNKWLGNIETVTDYLTPIVEQRYRATLNIDPGDPKIGEDATSGLHWMLGWDLKKNDELGVDSHPARGDFLPPVPLPRRMWAGSQIKVIKPLRVGDKVIKKSKVADIKLKEGRTGQLCFVTAEYEFLVNEEVRLHELHNIVYRDVTKAGGGSGVSDTIPEDADYTETIFMHPTLAFGKLKNLVHNSFLDSLEGQMEYEARMISDSAKTKDGLNGIDAFVNKKKVSFKGE